MSNGAQKTLSSLRAQPGPLQDCWKQIGVFGDKSCPELPRQIHCRNCPIFEQGAHQLFDRESPAGYVEEWTRLLAREKETEQRLSHVAMVFRIGSEWLGLPGACCLEVVSQRPVRRLPLRSNQTLLGLVSVRGELILCFSLLEPLGLASPAAPASPAVRVPPRLIIVGKPRFKLTFQADEVLGLQRYSTDMVGPLPATNARAVPRLTSGVLTVNGRQAGLLDHERLFAALEESLA